MTRADYPPDWGWIARQIRAQAGDRCEGLPGEECGVANGAVGARDRHGAWHNEDAIRGLNGAVGESLWPDGFPRMVRVVLTTAHLCHEAGCSDPGHLRSMCQRCHFSLDREDNMRKRRERTGQAAMDLSFGLRPAAGGEGR